MPTYDYECDACGHTWEIFQPITADPISKCPACGKKKARRLFGTGAALMFKGSGFYETDYRSESYKKSAKAEQSSTESGGSGSSGKAESNQTASDSQSPSASPTGDSNSATNAQKKSKRREKKD
jgi:putative FmdB family regulatory protein